MSSIGLLLIVDVKVNIDQTETTRKNPSRTVIRHYKCRGQRNSKNGNHIRMAIRIPRKDDYCFVTSIERGNNVNNLTGNYMESDDLQSQASRICSDFDYIRMHISEQHANMKDSPSQTVTCYLSAAMYE